MPNHVLNELTFRDVDLAKKRYILALTGDPVNFDILVPTPLNLWLFSVSQKHEKTFVRNALDWSRENWGTKWNAYSHQPTEQTEDTLILRFETAWSPPYPWLAALFNTLKNRFEHAWMSEGGGEAMGIFEWPKDDNDLRFEPWKERPLTNEEHRRLHKLRYGVEEFTDDDEA
jgi:hypothetical protein